MVITILDVVRHGQYWRTAVFGFLVVLSVDATGLYATVAVGHDLAYEARLWTESYIVGTIQ